MSLATLSLPVAQTSAQLLDIDATRFADCFDKEPFRIGHALASHPLFAMDRILELVRSLPESQIEYNAGTVPIGCDPSATPRNGLSAEETVRRIQENKSWLVAKNVETDPDYQLLLEQCLREVGVHSELVSPGMKYLEAFIFVSSPGAITPYHMDPEHNFLLQIRGSKQMTLFDRSLVTAEQLEKFYQGAHRNMPFDDAFMTRSETFEMKPGEGLHVPVAMPHFVRVGSEMSISFSITFRTPDLTLRSDAHVVNSWLRNAGLKPAPVGASTARDRLKSLTCRAWRRSQQLLQRPAGTGASKY